MFFLSRNRKKDRSCVGCFVTCGVLHDGLYHVFFVCVCLSVTCAFFTSLCVSKKMKSSWVLLGVLFVGHY